MGPPSLCNSFRLECPVQGSYSNCPKILQKPMRHIAFSEGICHLTYMKNVICCRHIIIQFLTLTKHDVCNNMTLHTLQSQFTKHDVCNNMTLHTMQSQFITVQNSELLISSLSLKVSMRIASMISSQKFDSLVVLMTAHLLLTHYNNLTLLI